MTNLEVVGNEHLPVIAVAVTSVDTVTVLCDAVAANINKYRNILS